MKTIDKFSFWFIGLGFPFVVIAVIAISFFLHNDAVDSFVKHYETTGAWGVLGCLIIAWVFVTFVFLLRILFSENLRNLVFKKFSKIEERDEREMEIAGESAKFSFIANLAFWFFLMFLSCLTLGVKKYETPQISTSGEKKGGTMSVGFNFNPINTKSFEMKKENGIEEASYNALPLNPSGLIILLIIFQIGSYHLRARKFNS